MKRIRRTNKEIERQRHRQTIQNLIIQIGMMMDGRRKEYNLGLDKAIRIMNSYLEYEEKVYGNIK
jgi:hypothetical protein